MSYNPYSTPTQTGFQLLQPGNDNSIYDGAVHSNTDFLHELTSLHGINNAASNVLSNANSMNSSPPVNQMVGFKRKTDTSNCFDSLNQIIVQQSDLSKDEKMERILNLCALKRRNVNNNLDDEEEAIMIAYGLKRANNREDVSPDMRRSKLLMIFGIIENTFRSANSEFKIDAGLANLDCLNDIINLYDKIAKAESGVESSFNDIFKSCDSFNKAHLYLWLKIVHHAKATTPIWSDDQELNISTYIPDLRNRNNIKQQEETINCIEDIHVNDELVKKLLWLRSFKLKDYEPSYSEDVDELNDEFFAEILTEPVLNEYHIINLIDYSVYVKYENIQETHTNKYIGTEEMIRKYESCETAILKSFLAEKKQNDAKKTELTGFADELLKIKRRNDEDVFIWNASIDKSNIIADDCISVSQMLINLLFNFDDTFYFYKILNGDVNEHELHEEYPSILEISHEQRLNRKNRVQRYKLATKGRKNCSLSLCHPSNVTLRNLRPQIALHLEKLARYRNISKKAFPHTSTFRNMEHFLLVFFYMFEVYEYFFVQQAWKNNNNNTSKSKTIHDIGQEDIALYISNKLVESKEFGGIRVRGHFFSVNQVSDGTRSRMSSILTNIFQLLPSPTNNQLSLFTHITNQPEFLEICGDNDPLTVLLKLLGSGIYW